MFTKANPARLKARSVERINFAVVAVTATLFLAIAVFVAFSTSKMMENEARSTVENVVKATVGRIDRQMASVESAVENSAWIVEERISDPDYMFRITGELVQNNPFIVGSTVAFEPNFFPSKGYYYSAFSCKDGRAASSASSRAARRSGTTRWTGTASRRSRGSRRGASRTSTKAARR